MVGKYLFIEALHYAGMSDESFEIFKEICDENPDWINVINRNGANPLLIAIKSGNIKMVDFMLSKVEVKEILQKRMFLEATKILSELNSSDFENDLVKNLEEVWLNKKEVDSLLLQHQMYDLVLGFLNKNKITLEAKDLTGKTLMYFLLGGHEKNIDLIEKYNIETIINDEVIMQFLRNFTINKSKWINVFLMGIDILNYSIGGKDLIDYVAELNITEENKDVLLEELENKFVR